MGFSRQGRPEILIFSKYNDVILIKPDTVDRYHFSVDMFQKFEGDHEFHHTVKQLRFKKPCCRNMTELLLEWHHVGN